MDGWKPKVYCLSVCLVQMSAPLSFVIDILLRYEPLKKIQVLKIYINCLKKKRKKVKKKKKRRGEKKRETKEQKEEREEKQGGGSDFLVMMLFRIMII